MKNYKLLLLTPLLLLSAVSCSSSNQFSNVGQDVPDSLFYRCADNYYDEEYSDYTFSKTEISVNLDEYTRINYSSFYYKYDSEASVYSLFCTEKGIVLGDKYTADSISNGIIEHAFYLTESGSIIAGAFDSVNEAYNYTLFNYDGDELENFSSKSEIEIETKTEETVDDGLYTEVTVLADKTKKIYLESLKNNDYVDAISKHTNIIPYDAIYSSGDSKIAGYTLTEDDVTIVYDAKGNFLHKIDLSFITNLSDYSQYYFYNDTTDVYIKTTSYYDSSLDKGSEDTFKTSAYVVNYMKGTIKYYDSLPFALLGHSSHYNNDENIHVVSYYTLDEKGRKSSVLYCGELTSSLDNLKGQYRYTSTLFKTITALNKTSFILNDGNQYIYYSKNKCIPLTKMNYFSYSIDGKVRFVDTSGNSIIFNGKKFLDEYNSYVIDESKTRYDFIAWNNAAKSHSLITDKKTGVCVLDGNYELDSGTGVYASSYGIFESDGKIYDLNGNVLLTLSSSQHFTSAEYYSDLLEINIHDSDTSTDSKVYYIMTKEGK